MYYLIIALCSIQLQINQCNMGTAFTHVEKGPMSLAQCADLYNRVYLKEIDPNYFATKRCVVLYKT